MLANSSLLCRAIQFTRNNAYYVKYDEGKSYFAIKFDLSKAYDKLILEIIWRILTNLRLSERMVNVIMHFITNVKWNGARADYFRP